MCGSYGRALVVLVLDSAVGVSAGDGHTCALDASGGVWCWGLNTSGQLGDGTNDTERHLPLQVMGIPSVQQVSAGFRHTCAVRTNGTGWCWGLNDAGQLGDGTLFNSNTPQAVAL